MTGPSASGSEKGAPSSTRSAPRLGVGTGDGEPRSRGRGSRPSGRASAPRGPRRGRPRRRPRSARCRSLPRDQPSRSASFAMASARSLSPGRTGCRTCPHVLRCASGRAPAVRVGRQKPGDRVRRLERGDDALEPGELAEGASASSSVTARSGRGRCRAGGRARGRRPGSRGRRRSSAPRGSGPPRRRARRRARRAGRRCGRRVERGAVAAGVDALARRLDADQLDVGVVEEAGEGPDRVRAAADAGDHPRRGGRPRPRATCSRASSPITRCRSRTSAG